MVTIKKTRLTGVCFFRELHGNTNETCLVLDLLNEPPERNVLEVLFLLLPHLDFLFPAIVLADDDATNAMLDALSHNELAGMVKVILNAEVPFPARSLVGMFIVQPIDALEDTTVDQYRMTELTGGYRSQVVYANVDAQHLVLADFLFLAFLFVLYVHHETEGLGRQNDLLVLPRTLDIEAVVSGCDGVRLLLNLVLSSFDGFVVEDNLSQLILVIRRFWHSPELAWVFLVGVQCLFEVRPVGQALAYGLLRRLRIVQVAEAILVLDSGNEDIDVRQRLITEPCLSHEEIALVVQFLAECAESDDFRRAVNQMSFNH